MVEIELSSESARFEPGDQIDGQVRWDAPSPPEKLEIRLFWYTRGKGTQDAEVVERLDLRAATAQGRRPFRFRLPNQPYSFSGQFVSLVWALELVMEPPGETARVEFTMSPTGEEIKIAP